ncbi:hypothetical protein [Nocardioides sp. YIM 152588]|uniref:hypothetical protein n=1 Tax=Nocardioides sp. YIM 152588 TaxID=3158259 RepID=UPI0032E398D6
MTTPRLRRSLIAMTATLAIGGTLVACGSDEEAVPEATGEGELADVCPANIVIQSDWEPEAEHGGIYQLVGDGYVIDTDKKSVTGPLLDAGEDTGVTVEIRIGGASVGYASVSQLMNDDPDIMMGFSRVGDSIATQKTIPVTAVMASMEKSPYGIYWDADTYPEVETIADLQDTDAVIMIGNEAEVWVSYLIEEGVLDEDQLDRSAQDKPAAFVGANGENAEIGFMTAEPNLYSNGVWGEFNIKGQLLDEAGYPEYFQSVVVNSSDIEDKADCLELLVPMMQQAQLDYRTDPAATNDLIVELVEEYQNAWQYDLDAANYAHDKGVEIGILADSEDGVTGKFDMDRVQELLDIVSENPDVDAEGLTADELATNQFIDESIGG